MKKLAILAAGAILLGGLALFQVSRRPDSNPVDRGWRLAQQHGCFGCHGPEGGGGVPNPGSNEKEIPAWDGGMLFMYVNQPGEIREWILYGLPRRLWPDGEPPHSHGAGGGHDHPNSTGGLVPMPAYEQILSSAEVDDLVALVQHLGSYQRPASPPDARQGFETAANLGCFGCHRQGGRVGLSNPGSFKGYIPPWVGPDFAELVRSEQELRQWILEGRIDRLENDPLARFFTDRQTVRMPAYRDHLSGDELDSIVAYIDWLNRSGGESRR